MHRTDKEQVVEELTRRLAATESLIVADYRGLTNTQLRDVRAKLREHGATFTVVKNTLTRRAAAAAGADALLALLEGPTAIAFVEADGDPAAVAKALADTARDTKILSLRGGLLAGTTMQAADVEELAKLPPVDVLKSQLVGVIVAPLTQLLGLLQAPLRDLVGLLDARIAQLEEGGDASASAPAADGPAEEPAAEEPPADEPAADAAAPEAESEEAESEEQGEEPQDEPSDAPAGEAAPPQDETDTTEDATTEEEQD